MMRTEPYTSMIIGLGQIGMGYDLTLENEEHIYTHARAFSSHPDFDLVCGVDPSSERREEFLKYFGCPAYATIEDALVIHSIDVAVVAVPTFQHATILRKVLELSDPKAFICEKPLAGSIEDAREMVEMCSDANVDLYVNYNRCSSPGAIEVKKMINSGELAPPFRGVIWYSKGFIHNGSHFFNLAEYWLGEFKNAQIIDVGRDFDGVGSEPEVKVKFAKGEFIFVPAWEEHFSHYTVELLSSSGRLYWGEEGLHLQKPMGHSTLKSYKTLSPIQKFITTEMDRYQWHVTDQLSRALSGKDSFICSGEMALNTFSAMTKIIEMKSK